MCPLRGRRRSSFSPSPGPSSPSPPPRLDTLSLTSRGGAHHHLPSSIYIQQQYNQRTTAWANVTYLASRNTIKHRFNLYQSLILEGLPADSQVHGSERARYPTLRAAHTPLLKHSLHLVCACRRQPYLGRVGSGDGRGRLEFGSDNMRVAP